MKKLFTNKFLISILFVGITILTLSLRSIIANEKHDIKTLLFIFQVYLITSLFSTNDLVPKSVKETINRINYFVKNGWFNLILFCLFVVFIEYYVEIKTVLLKWIFEY